MLEVRPIVDVVCPRRVEYGQVLISTVAHPETRKDGEKGILPGLTVLPCELDDVAMSRREGVMPGALRAGPFLRRLIGDSVGRELQGITSS